VAGADSDHAFLVLRIATIYACRQDKMQ